MKHFQKIHILISLILVFSLLLFSCKTEQTTENNGNTQGIESSETNSEIKNLILVIGDGMGQEHISAGESVYEESFAFSSWDRVSVNTNSVDSDGFATVLTDSAAAATALATGTLTQNGYVGVDKDKNELQTVLDYARSLGKKTGIVTTDKLYGATPAGFSAHSESRSNSAQIAASALLSEVDLLIGASSNTCKNAYDANSNGYTYIESIKSGYENLSEDKLYGNLKIEGYSSDSDAIFLKDAAKLAIDFLDNDNGFVLVIEQAHIDKFAHSNDFENTTKMVKSLDETIDRIIDWIGDKSDTAVIVTSDHETGGLRFCRENLLPDSFKSKNGNDVYYTFTSTSHTNAYVGLFIYGTEYNFASLPFFKSNHIIKNCDVALLIKELIDG